MKKSRLPRGFKAGTLENLINAICTARRKVTFLVGSALTAPRVIGEPGVPSTTEILELIRGAARTANCADEVEAAMRDQPAAISYQKGMERVALNTSMGFVNEIVKQAVACALKEPSNMDDNYMTAKPSSWHLNSSVMAIANLYQQRRDIFSGMILTTNFDTLIETAFEAKDLSCASLALDGDYSLGPHFRQESQVPQVIHLHGTWQSDTLHTSLQLERHRNNLKNGLVKILCDSTLVVLAYGGWDDVFMASLSEAASNENNKIDILWSFHGKSTDRVFESHGHVFAACESLLPTYRFRAYLGVDIHDLFQLLSNRLLATGPDNTTAVEVAASETSSKSTEAPSSSTPNLTTLDEDEKRSTEAPRDSEEASLGDLWNLALSDSPSHIGLPARIALGSVRDSDPALFSSTLTTIQSALHDPYIKSLAPNQLPFHGTRHVLIAAPTSSGKSTVAEMFLLRPPLLNRVKTLSIYIAPTRALAQAKYEELQEKIKQIPQLRKGLILSTGEDNSDDWQLNHGTFAIACMVYEKASMLFSRNPILLQRLGCLLIDEAFMLGELIRGAALEVALAKALHRRRIDDATEDRGAGECLRVVTLSTENTAIEDLSNLLLSLDTTTDDESPPLIFRDNTRPISVEHCLLLPKPPSPDKQPFTVFPFLTFSGSTSRALDSVTMERIEKDLHPIAEEILEGREGFTRSVVVEHRDRLLRFALSRLENKPRGYRLLVFAPGKQDVETLAGAIFNHRASLAGDSYRRHRISELLRLINDGEDQQLGKIIARYAEKGVFFHHSDIERPIRAEIERLAASRDTSAPAEVLISTTTLAYGVNLAVSEVVLAGVRFYVQNRAGKVRRDDLSEADYHNMTGRAGRLGRETGVKARAFISLPLGIMQPFSVIKYYYQASEPLKSRFFVKDDAKPKSGGKIGNPALQKALAAALTDYKQEEGSNIKSYTPPFVQAVLDTLRHLNYTVGGGRQSTKPVHFSDDPSGNDIVSFLTQTLFYSQNHSSGKKLTRFIRSVRNVLQACAAAPLSLVSSPSEDVFEISEAGEAVIDTGTEIGTVRTLATAATLVRETWDSVFPERQFPPELFVFVLLMQEEVFRVTVENTPEGRSGGKRRPWSDDIESTNRDVVEGLFCRALQDGCGIEDQGSSLWTQLRRKSAEFETVRLLKTPYAGGGVDSLCRLFCSIIAWINGESLTQARRFAEKLVPKTGQPANKLDGLRMNFRQLSEKLRYKAIFLAKLLAAGSSKLQVTLEEQRLVFLLAERLRLGARLDAIPLFYPRASNLSRGEAHRLVDEGWSAENILTRSRSELPGIPLSGKKLAQLQEDLEEFCVGQLRQLAVEMTVGSLGTVREEAVSSFWKKLSGSAAYSFFGESIDAYRAETELGLSFAELFIEHFDLSRWLPHEEVTHRYGSVGGFVAKNRPSDGDGALDRIWSGRKSEDSLSIKWFFEEANEESEDGSVLIGEGSYRITDVFEICAVNVRRDWSICDSLGEWKSLSDYLRTRSEDQVVICPVPWLPPGEALGKERLDELDEMWQKRQFLFITPAALAVLSSFIVKRLVADVSIVGQLFGLGLSRGWRVLLTVADVREALVETAPDPVPRSIREALLSYTDIVTS